MYKSFGQFLFEASETTEERKKAKDMADKLKAAKQATVKAKEVLNDVEGDKDSDGTEIKKAKLTATKASAAAVQIDADIKLKALAEKPKEEKKADKKDDKKEKK
jgi:hypothetical protein